MDKEKISCRHCGSFDTVKKGARKIRWGKGQIYSCKNCFKRFSLGMNKKQFDAWLIVNAVCAYNRGYSYDEVSELMARKHKVKVGKSSVERWAKEYGLGFLEIRDRIISKYGRDCVIERAFNHSGLIYNVRNVVEARISEHPKNPTNEQEGFFGFKLHKGKLKEFGKFSGLKDFIFSIAKGVEEKFFDGERCSQSREGISCNIDVNENSRLNSVVGEMLKIVRSNKQRHALVENLMLHCDRDTVAVEVPVWYWNKREDTGVCGHIDVLQVKFGKIWIFDYVRNAVEMRISEHPKNPTNKQEGFFDKPDAAGENFERVMSQLYNYALALSFRTGVSLGDIKCAWFDASKIYSFSPEKIVLGRTEDKETREFNQNEELSKQINLKGELS